ncbi:MAG: EAL domain-containing protein [Paracoccaceae bacterium]
MTAQAIGALVGGIAGAAGSLRRIESALVLLSLALSGLAFGPAGMAVNAAVLVPVVIGMASLRLARSRSRTPARHAMGSPLRAEAVDEADRAMKVAAGTGKSTACILIAIDDPAETVERFGRAAFEAVLARAAERVDAALREGDMTLRLEDARFAVVLQPARRADLEALIQISARLAAAVAEPVSVDATTVYVTASCGFCLSGRAPEPDGRSLFAAAEEAAEEALRNGPGAIRAWSKEIARAAADRSSLRDAVAQALEQGGIVAHFQPQLSTDTGEVAGFEVLARWAHPKRGLILPGEFLPAIHSAGLSERLGEVMCYHALTALRAWDRAGRKVAHVAVNLSRDELRNPRLADRLKWELDRFEIAPGRLTLEILESVAADAADDVVVRNVAALAALGCRIDLDDFGTGAASIAQLRRFAVHRIKIDRSFVTHVDTDQSQRRMVAALLSMAEQLGLETVAEGVETVGEHAILAQLGSTYVQGFGIARPMPFEDTIAWLDRHSAKLTEAPKIARKTG